MLTMFPNQTNLRLENIAVTILKNIKHAQQAIYRHSIGLVTDEINEEPVLRTVLFTMINQEAYQQRSVEIKHRLINQLQQALLFQAVHKKIWQQPEIILRTIQDVMNQHFPDLLLSNSEQPSYVPIYPDLTDLDKSIYDDLQGYDLRPKILIDPIEQITIPRLKK